MLSEVPAIASILVLYFSTTEFTFIIVFFKLLIVAISSLDSSKISELVEPSTLNIKVEEVTCFPLLSTTNSPHTCPTAVVDCIFNGVQLTLLSPIITSCSTFVPSSFFKNNSTDESLRSTDSPLLNKSIVKLMESPTFIRSL